VCTCYKQPKLYFSLSLSLCIGGNPVSCAAGLAVLEVLEEEQLMSHAHKVGTYLRTKLIELSKLHCNIGDVRGR
jgi:4-aminobutyrate aminotransferase-like enzyme